MKKIFFILSCLLLTSAAWSQQYERQKEQRAEANVCLNTFEQGRTQLFNFDWRFHLGNPKGAEQMGYDDSKWRTLDLPHDFQFEQPWDEECGGARGFKPMCEGWYRKQFVVPQEWEGREVLIDFGGIMYYGDVYVNGHKVASTEYGYLGFEADISKYLKYGEQNLVAVYANTGKVNGSRWYTGGGLFRDVKLHLQNPTHISRHGVYVHTPEVTDAQAKVQVVVDVTNFRDHHTVVRATVRNREGKALASTEATMNRLTKHRHDEVSLPTMDIHSPHRWDIDDPYLYKVEVEVMADSMLVDRRTETFGIRTIEYGPKFGFRLNGRKVFLKGMANHHDMGALGAASFDRGIIRQMETMKQFGFNCLRCSHNPYSESLTHIADSLGILIVDELIDKWSDDEYWGGRKPFMQIWPELIREWTTRDRNCPSVILWSLGNELQTRPNWSGYDTNDWGITTYRVFDQMVKRYDRTRPTTVAQFPARAGAIREEKEFRTYFAPPELGCATEVNSFNYQWDCYPKYFEYEPNLILFQSEAVTNQLVAPFYGMDQRRTVGLAYWGAIEYWGESNKWPKKGWNYSFFSHTLAPYPQAYLIKGAFEPEEPVVRIGVMNGGESISWNDEKVGQRTYAESWNHPEGSSQHVVAFTNADEVELIVNGKSQGRKPNDTTNVFRRGSIAWPRVAYERGGAIEAIAYRGGVEVARHKIETTGPAVGLRIETERPTMTADGMDLQYIHVYAVDKRGHRVPTADHEVTISVEGQGRLLAVDNGDHYTDQLFLDTPTKRLKDGSLLAIIRSTRQAGKVKVTAKATGLGTKSHTFVASVQ